MKKNIDSKHFSLKLSILVVYFLLASLIHINSQQGCMENEKLLKDLGQGLPNPHPGAKMPTKTF